MKAVRDTTGRVLMYVLRCDGCGAENSFAPEAFGLCPVCDACPFCGEAIPTEDEAEHLGGFDRERLGCPHQDNEARQVARRGSDDTGVVLIASLGRRRAGEGTPAVRQLRAAAPRPTT